MEKRREKGRESNNTASDGEFEETTTAPRYVELRRQWHVPTWLIMAGHKNNKDSQPYLYLT